MVDTKAKTFAAYALTGFYEKHKAGSKKDKKLLMMKKSGMQLVLGTSRIGSAQRDQLIKTCIEQGTAVVELSDRFIFFNPDDVEGLFFDMTSKAQELKDLTLHFDKLKKTEAEREWSEMFEE